MCRDIDQGGVGEVFGDLLGVLRLPVFGVERV